MVLTDESRAAARRSSRRREGKSYAEDDFDYGLSNVSNGDVEMESSDEDSDTPLEPLPLPKKISEKVLKQKTALIRYGRQFIDNLAPKIYILESALSLFYFFKIHDWA